MKITIFGIGYVGTVSAACLLRDGHSIVGVDISEEKVADLAAGKSPVSEPQVDELLAAGHAAGRLSATTNIGEAVRDADMLWICVGTPTRPDGGVNLRAVDSAIDEIGQEIAATAARPLVVIRSTVVPQTTRTHIVPRLEESSGLRVDHDVDVVFHPEFLREGVAVEDFNNPSRIVIGEDRVGAGDELMQLYQRYPGPRFSLTSAEAELLKYSDNAFHAAKVTFANEIGMLGRSLGIDSRTVAEAFCADTKLNISPKYLRPGFAFGGSCLPKDVRAILRKATELGVEVPLLNSLLESNRYQIESLALRVLANHPTKVGLVGLAFKPATDDMRESPYVTVAKRLIGEGVTVRIYDPEVDPSQLTGSNATAVRAAALHHLGGLLVDAPDQLAGCDAILVNHPLVQAPTVNDWLARRVRVFDLVGIADADTRHEYYEGIAW